MYSPGTNKKVRRAVTAVLVALFLLICGSTLAKGYRYFFPAPKKVEEPIAENVDEEPLQKGLRKLASIDEKSNSFSEKSENTPYQAPSDSERSAEALPLAPPFMGGKSPVHENSSSYFSSRSGSPSSATGASAADAAASSGANNSAAVTTPGFPSAAGGVSNGGSVSTPTYPVNGGSGAGVISSTPIVNVQSQQQFYSTNGGVTGLTPGSYSVNTTFGSSLSVVNGTTANGYKIWLGAASQASQ